MLSISIACGGNREKLKMTDIILNDKWKIVTDGYGNHSPHYLGETKNQKTGETNIGWKSSNQYFANTSQALKWIIQQELVEEEKYTFDEYIIRFESLLKEYF